MNGILINSIRIHQLTLRKLQDLNFKIDPIQEDDNLNWILFSKPNIKNRNCYKRICNMVSKDGSSCSKEINKRKNMYYHCYSSSIHIQENTSELQYIEKHKQKQGLR